jgi:hypothetical protein
MPALRRLLTLAVILAVTAGCTRTISGSGTPDASKFAGAAAPAPRTATPTPTATHNGVAGMSGDEALGTAYDALRRAPSLRLKGYLGAPGPERWTLELRYRGTDSDGAFVVDGFTVRIRKIGRSVYRMATPEYWRSRLGPASRRLPPGKWIKVPVTDKSLENIADLLQTDMMADAFLGVRGTLSTGVFRTVNGVETVPVTSDGPEKETVFVALTGEPYPVRIATGIDRGAVDFLDYGDPVRIAAPPRARVAEFPVLPGG